MCFLAARGGRLHAYCRDHAETCREYPHGRETPRTEDREEHATDDTQADGRFPDLHDWPSRVGEWFRGASLPGITGGWGVKPDRVFLES